VSSEHHIEVHYIAACSNWQRTVENLKVATALLDMRSTITPRCVESADDPAALGFAGSPTVLVDGIDPFLPSVPIDVLACRMYAWDGI
jgi:hypothetical protein